MMDIKLISSYLSKRWQRVKVKINFSSWKEVLDTCHLLISENKHEGIWVKIENETTCESNFVRLFEMAIDSKV